MSSTAAGLRAGFARFSKKVTSITLFLTVLSACNGLDGTAPAATDQTSGPPGWNLPTGGPVGNSQNVALGSTCVNSDPGHVCIGLKYVVYQDSSGNPVSTQQDALNNLKVTNQIWAQCNLAFQVEEYDAVDPTKLGLNLHPANTSELDPIRNVFDEVGRLIVVTTGTWNRTGTLGETSANAWTAMPGSGPFGSILEAAVGNYPYIYAHELGHYLNLEHVSNAADLMNPVIYTTSTVLTSSECAAARSTALGYWSEATRH